MQDVFDRFDRQSEEESKAEQDRGFQAGAAWAKEAGQLAHLKRLARAYGDLDGDHWHTGDNEAYGPAYHVLKAMDPDNYPSRAESKEFWKDALGDEYPEGDVLRGFVEGALSVWDAYLARPAK